MNAINLMGRLTQDPELKYTQSGKAVANFTLAVQRLYDKDKADFIRCTCWEKTADFAANYLSKGQRVAVQGRLQIDTGEGDDGVKKYYTSVVVDRIFFADSAKKNDNGGAEPGGYAHEVPMSDDLPFA
jgi:single-strand DNA-binding protein